MGFLLRDGEITSFDFPGAIFTLALHINPSGQIVGRYRATDGNYHGFLRSGEEFSSIDFPGAACTIATGINPRGDIVGSHSDVTPCSDSIAGNDGFLRKGEERDEDSGFVTFDFPGAAVTRAYAINASGSIVGTYRDSVSGPNHGFLLSRGENEGTSDDYE